MNEGFYVCPYCGSSIDRQSILFWERVKTQHTDNIRGEFLRRHGVSVPPGNKFPRKYYRVRRGEDGNGNVVREDRQGYPVMLEDHPGNAVAPEELGREGRRDDSFDFDEVFDSDGFDSYDESPARGGDLQDRELRNIPNRACPHCHCELPTQFGMLPTYHVAMFGGRASGKTAYLVNLFQQLDDQLRVCDLGSVALEAESEQFLRPKIEEYEETGTTRPTPADGGLLPIVCHYRNRGKEAFLTFYDIAGEGTGDPAYMANHQGIANCECLLLMIDPNMFDGGAFYSEWMANHAENGEDLNAGLECCREPLDRFLNQAGELCREYSERIRFVVCVVTKVDMLLEKEAKFFSAGDIELVTDVGEKHREAVDLSVLKRVNDNLRVYLKEQQKVDLKDKLLYTFGDQVRVSLLGVSTSTLAHSRPGQIRFEPRSSARDSKHRIVEPFLVTLMYFGLVPARTGSGNLVYYQEKNAAAADGNQVPSGPETGYSEPAQRAEPAQRISEPTQWAEPAQRAETRQEEKKKRGWFHWGRKK